MNMNEIVPTTHGDTTARPRREFLRASLLLAVAPLAATMPLPALSVTAAATFNPPTRKRGSATRNVRDYGAVGNGSHDDTAAFQRAIDSLPSEGGTVKVPAGTYLIDPVKRVSLRSRMHLRLANGAVLKTKANAAERSYVLMLNNISDVEISGGEILGDRDRHKSSAGEWGHGIMIRGCSRVTIRDILVRKCWGDGISIAATTKTAKNPGVGSTDIAVANVASVHNRRAGMSIGRATNVRVYDSTFSNTSGATPGCGINIETDNQNHGASEIHIENCTLRFNQGNGIQVYKRSKMVTIKKNLIAKNHGYGVLVMGASQGYMALNDIRNNGLIGVGIRAQCSDYTLSENRFYNNSRRFRSFDRAKVTPPFSLAGNVRPNHTEVVSSSGIKINVNLYYDREKG